MFAALASLRDAGGRGDRKGGVAGDRHGGGLQPQNLAVLMDLQSADPHAVESLFKRKLLAKNRVLTFADFTWGKEADIEDMFDVDFYLRLVNEDYRLQETSPLHALGLPQGGRILRRLEGHFAQHPLPINQGFRRERPARYFAENLTQLQPAISPATFARFETLFEQLNKML
jgi:hypothetical protein